ncbi:MAG: glycosyltransferase family 39 protein [bacterium]
MLTTRQYQVWYPVLAVLMFFSFYFAIGNYTLLNNNEGLYASIAKHMLINKAFVIPYLNCVPYIEKPPLLYWLLGLSFSIFGFTAFAARFVTATSATLLCCTMLYFTYKMKLSKIGIMATLIFASSIGVSIIARMVYFDMLLSFLIAGTLLCLFYWYESKKIAVLRIAYIFFGLAILCKGLIAIILICGSFSAFLLLEKSFWNHLRQAIDWPGIILFLAMVLPWHIAATLQHKGFFWNYIIGEHFLRFLNLREPHDYYQGSFYYYLPRILIYLFPWSFFVPLIFLQTKNLSVLEKKLMRFSWCWLLLPLIFFSLSIAKANYYMIVSMPALALILSVNLNAWFENKNTRLFSILVALILFILAVSLVISFAVFLPIFPAIITCKKSILGTASYGLLAGVTIISIFIRKPQVAAALLASLIIPIAITATSVLKLINEDISAAKAGIYLTENRKTNFIYIYQDFENISALAFYTNTCLRIIDSQSNDLHYGSHLPQFKQWFLTKKKFLRETKHQPYYLIVPNNKLEQFYKDMTQTKAPILRKFKKLTIIGNNYE